MRDKYKSTMYEFLKAADQVYGQKNEFLFDAFCDFFFEENDRKDAERNRSGAFLKTCRDYCRIGGYSVILRFITAVLNYRKKYNIAALGETLHFVEIKPDYTLRDLCSDFYKELLRSEGNCLDKLPDGGEAFLSAENIFAPEVTLPDYKNEYCRPHMEAALVVVCRKLYGIDGVDPNQITKELVDRLADAVRATEEEKYRERVEDLEELRREQEEYNKQHGDNGLGNLMIPGFSDEDRDHQLPGIFSLVLPLTEVKGQLELSFYFLSEYVFPFLKEYDWNNGDKSVECYAQIIKTYSDLIWALLGFHWSPIVVNIADENELYRRITQEPDEAFAEYAAEARAAMLLWAEILNKGAEIIKPAIGEDYFSFHITSAAYLLVLAKEYEASSRLLIERYYDIDMNHNCFYYSIIALVVNILHAEDINTTNILYGYFCGSETNGQRERYIVREACTFFREAEKYIKENDQLDYITDRRVYDILYTDDRVRGIEKALRRCEETNSIPDVALCAKMRNAFDGFRGKIGIDLGKFADRSNPEELVLTMDSPLQFICGGLSKKLRNTADRLYRKMDELALVNKNKEIESLRFGCNLLIQNKLIEMRRKAIVESADKLARIRDMELDSDAVTEMIIEETERLVSVLRPDDYDRVVTEKIINESHRSFCNTFYPNGERNLLAELPPHIRTELWGYFVTAEMVYRYLSEQNSSDLDYTPALISLTKALEFVLFEAYKRLDVTDISGIDSKVLSHCLWKNNNTNTYQGKNSQLELGSLIYLLKDGSKLFLEKAQGTVSYRNTLYGTSHFSKWNNGVFNISELSRFAGIDIIGTDFPDTSSTCTLHFSVAGNSEDNNRAILAYALDYIKQNYRNPAAHKDKMGQSAVEACRELMLSTEQMLWMLISVIDFSKPEI